MGSQFTITKKILTLRSLLSFNIFDPYFDPLAYEWVVNSFFKRQRIAEDLATIINRLIPQSKAIIVDMAAGTGVLSIPLAQLGYRVIGMDISNLMLEQIKEKASRFQISELRTVKHNFNSFSAFPSNSIDGYTCLAANRHITNLDVFLTEIYRTLKPGGYFVWPIFWSDFVHWKINAGLKQPVFSSTLAKIMAKYKFKNIKIDRRDSLIRNTIKGVPGYAIPAYIIAQK